MAAKLIGRIFQGGAKLVTRGKPRVANTPKSGKPPTKNTSRSKDKQSDEFIENRSNVPDKDIKSPQNQRNLYNSTRQRELMDQPGETFAGGKSDTKFRNADKAAKRYGGKAEDWTKQKTTPSGKTQDGHKFEMHYLKNNKTGQIEEPKTIFPNRFETPR
jgi:hypothetical protein